MKRMIAFICLCGMLVASLSGCSKQNEQTNPGLDTTKEVTLVLSGGWVESPAFETMAQKFNEKYPNCTVVYEYLQNYDESLLTRLQNAEYGIDIFLTTNIQADSDNLPYALDLFSVGDALDLSDVHEGLIKNFTYINTDKNAAPQIYAIPIGAELRGVFVNKTLLAAYGLTVPEDRAQFFAACKTLSEAGYIPVQANPSFAGQQMMYPYVCNLIANADNYEETYDMVNRCEPGVSELFREPCSVLYDLMQNNYYNYKYVETELGAFTQTSSDAMAKDFLNIKAGADGSFEKVDDQGTVAFMPSTMSLGQTIERIKRDYHSQIEYAFILAPVGDNGGFAYMSPASGIAVNKNSENLDWAIEFMNFFFASENNKAFAEVFDIIPCTSDALEYITKRFDLPADRVSQLGQVSFDYKFYSLINNTLLSIIKGNNPKYMDQDEAGNTKLFSLDHYMQQLEEAFLEQRQQVSETGN